MKPLEMVKSGFNLNIVLPSRPKHRIALELLDRAEANGVHLEWITADIWYSEKPDFLAGLVLSPSYRCVNPCVAALS